MDKKYHPSSFILINGVGVLVKPKGMRNHSKKALFRREACLPYIIFLD